MKTSLIIAAIALFFAGCSTPDDGQMEAAAREERGEFRLYFGTETPIHKTK